MGRKMKNILMVILLSPLFFESSFAEKNSVQETNYSLMSKSEKKANIKLLTGRLYEIRTITESVQLSSLEKQQLRKEVKGIKDKLEKMDGVYLYLSATAILIIILLIVLL